MFAIIVTEKGGDQRRLEFDKSEVTIGRVQGNDVILPKGNVSKRHARIVLKDGKFIIVDLKSTNGTYVNGRKITSPLVVKDNDKIYIGDFIIGVDGASVGAGAPAGDAGGYGAPPPAPEPMGGPPPGPPGPPPGPPPEPPGPPPAPPGPPPAPRHSPTSRPVPPPQPAPAGVSDAGSAPMPPGPPPPAPSPSPQLSSRPNRAPAPAAPPPAPAPAASSGGAPRVTAPSIPPVAAKDSSPPRMVGAGAPRPTAMRPAAPPTASRGVQSSPLDDNAVRMLELQESILDRLVPRLDLDNVPVARLGEEALWQKAESAIVDLVETLDSSGELPGFVDQDTLIKEALNEALGLGPLEDLLADDEVEEIIVDRRDRIFMAKGGVIAGSGKAFSSDESFRRVVERLVAPTGHVINEASPLIDVRLRDGSRLAAALPPVAVRGACLTLRKPRASTYLLADMVQSGTLSAQMADFLTTCVSARRNILVCGAPGAGKSMVLTALANAVPAGERIVSVEEVAELALDREEWIALEARPGDGNGVSDVDLGMVLHSALRMRPDRLVVGDVRGPEAMELIAALGSSSDGSLASVAGEGAQAALARLTAMARLAAPGAATDALREVVAGAVDVVVYVASYADGAVRVASIAEVQGAGPDGFQVQEVFCFRGGSGDGGFLASGVVPAFYSELEARGVPADTSIFRS